MLPPPRAYLSTSKCTKHIHTSIYAKDVDTYLQAFLQHGGPAPFGFVAEGTERTNHILGEKHSDKLDPSIR